MRILIILVLKELKKRWILADTCWLLNGKKGVELN
jgi:hypothetical protein